VGTSRRRESKSAGERRNENPRLGMLKNQKENHQTNPEEEEDESRGGLEKNWGPGSQSATRNLFNSGEREEKLGKGKNTT